MRNYTENPEHPKPNFLRAEIKIVLGSARVSRCQQDQLHSSWDKAAQQTKVQCDRFYCLNEPEEL